MRAIDIYHFNDFHRHLEPFEDGSGGAARLTTLARQKKSEHPDSVLVNVGDVAGDQTAHGPQAFDPLADVFDAMGVEILGLGNHEFEDPQGDYQSLRQGLLEPFDGEVLCANVTSAETGKPIEGTKPFTVRQLAGINVAFIGVVTRELTSNLFPSAGAGLSTAPIEDTLRELVPQARQAGADVVVVLDHDGLRGATQVAREVDGIDLVLAAHDHRETAEPLLVERPDGGVTAVAEAGGYGKNLGHVRLLVDPEKKRVVSVEGRLIPVSADLPPDPDVQAILERYPGPEPLTERPEPKRWYTVGNSFADLAKLMKNEEKDT